MAEKMRNTVYSRSGASDTYLFNESLTSIYRPRVVDALRYLHPHPEAALESAGPEVAATFSLLLHHLSVFSHDATFGGLLYNMVYRVLSPSGERVSPSPLRKALHVAGATFGIAAWTRLQALSDGLPLLAPLPTPHPSADNDDDDSAERGGLGRLILRLMMTGQGRWVLLRWCVRVLVWLVKVGTLGNWILFLQDGHYACLWDRVMGMHLVRRNPEKPRYVALHFMDRSLGWIAMAQASSALIPFLNIPRAKTALRYWLGTALDALKSSPLGTHLFGSPDSAFDSSAKEGGHGGPTPCILCDVERVHHPFAYSPCGHSGCYYCLAAPLNAATSSDPGSASDSASASASASFSCPLCATTVASLDHTNP